MAKTNWSSNAFKGLFKRKLMRALRLMETYRTFKGSWRRARRMMNKIQKGQQISTRASARRITTTMTCCLGSCSRRLSSLVKRCWTEPRWQFSNTRTASIKASTDSSKTYLNYRFKLNAPRGNWAISSA